MAISFSPVLDEVVRLPVPLDATSIRLSFTAVMFVYEYRQFDRQGAQLQLWSDIDGSWGELDFEAPDIDENPSSHGDDFEQVVLRLTVDASLKPRTRTFSFTYRILYPTGEVRWMGQADKNGAFLIRRSKFKGQDYPNDSHNTTVPRPGEKEGILPNGIPPPSRVQMLPPTEPPRSSESSSSGSHESRPFYTPSTYEDLSGAGKHTTRPSMSPSRRATPDKGGTPGLSARRQAPPPLSSMIQTTLRDQSKDERMPGRMGTASSGTAVSPSEWSPSIASPRGRLSSESAEILQYWREEFIPRRHAPVPSPTTERVTRPVSRPPSAALPTVPDAQEDLESSVVSVSESLSAPFMLWGWVLDEDVYIAGSQPACHTLSDRYARFLKAMKKTDVADVSRFKGFVSLDAAGNPISQFCFYFASNRSEKDLRKKLSKKAVDALMKAAGTARRPQWISIQGSESPSYIAPQRVN
ncbi:hypothetical protein CYLTODRAFT_487488 [Cylindrobasidium torrendii FP15055 ss-10]|uniref:Uncharacterized protein n=1 Tax=Cylindrobasidium torrendii FP15055 ss-10 TaxID=1314674 RepID=A0A0D7BKM8_9AGAR|nr:hypothetical protein CYLTODRAFT_487488 [Cylindrobasidium torrendii FP15055 ss-10]